WSIRRWLGSLVLLLTWIFTRSRHGRSSPCSSRSPSSPSASGCKLCRPGIRPMSSLSRALIILLTLLAGAAAAQDVITVGTVTADGPSVDVPVFIRDTAGARRGQAGRLEDPGLQHQGQLCAGGRGAVGEL